jgi:hypothetical protein
MNFVEPFCKYCGNEIEKILDVVRECMLVTVI